jgi:hypothetical protein
LRASRRMAASPCVAILRDASLRDAPLDVVSVSWSTLEALVFPGARLRSTRRRRASDDLRLTQGCLCLATRGAGGYDCRIWSHIGGGWRWISSMRCRRRRGADQSPGSTGYFCSSSSTIRSTIAMSSSRCALLRNLRKLFISRSPKTVASSLFNVANLVGIGMQFTAGIAGLTL